MSGYTKLVFPSGMGADFQPAFQEAAAFWNNVVTAGAPTFTFKKNVDLSSTQCGVSHQFVEGETLDGLMIFAQTPLIDGPGAILGRAGPCMFNGDYPLLGIMEFDSADADALVQSGQFTAVVVHEMGHVLGLGTLWPLSGLLEGPCPLFGGTRPCAPLYLGAHGNEGFAELNPPAELGSKAPVANTGGSGTANGHWREETFENELMTGYLNAGIPNPLSIMTVKALKDLGYSVDLSAAEGYTMPANLGISDRAELNTLKAELKGDILIFDHLDINDVVERIGVNAIGEESTKAEFSGVFIVMIAGFAMLASLMMYLQRGQRKAIEQLQASRMVATKSPMHTHELA